MSLHVAAIIMASVFGLCGIIAVTAAIFNADWFYGTANVKIVTRGLSRTAQRIIYGLAGALMIAASIRLLTVV